MTKLESALVKQICRCNLDDLNCHRSLTNSFPSSFSILIQSFHVEPNSVHFSRRSEGYQRVSRKAGSDYQDWATFPKLTGQFTIIPNHRAVSRNSGLDFFSSLENHTEHSKHTKSLGQGIRSGKNESREGPSRLWGNQSLYQNPFTQAIFLKI